MKSFDFSRVQTPKFLASLALGGFLLASVSANAWEVGYMGTVIKGRSSGGTGLSYGGDVMVQEDIGKFFDVGLRAGYTKSDCFGVKYVPIQGTASFKYPIGDGTWVPYVGLGIGYHVFTGGTIDLENTVGYYPRIGLNYRIGKEKHWAIFIEATYRIMKTDITGGNTTETEAKLDGGGGSFGFSYRF
jgi:hypothetical protein